MTCRRAIRLRFLVLTMCVNPLCFWFGTLLCSNDGSPPLNRQVKQSAGRLSPFFPVFPRFLLKLPLFSAFPEDEEDGAAEAEGGPDEVQAEFLAHVEHGERHEHGKRDSLLHDLQLRE